MPPVPPATPNTKPTAPGSDDHQSVIDPANNGSWIWDGTQWTWHSASTMFSALDKSKNPSGLQAGSVPVSFGGPPTTAGTQLPGPAKLNLANDQPFGDQYSTNLNYRPFGLSPSMQGGYGGMQQGGAYGSDQLVPTLEQIRMQRLLQAYSPNYGGRF